MSFTDHLMQQPLWVPLWVGWMVVVNTAAVLFLRHPPARWVLAAWVGNMLTMQALFAAVGYVRLLGLSHVLWWTPLVIYLAPRWQGTGEPTAYRIWLRVLFVTILLSLVLDYIDVARYLLGDRS